MTRARITRSRLFVAVVLAAGLTGVTTDGLAQSPQPGPRGGNRPIQGVGGDQPVQRTLPRQAIYGNLSRELTVNEADAESLAQSVENRGFPLREALVLLLIAKARADNLIGQGKFTKDQQTQAIRTSADLLIDLVDKDQAGWLALVEKSGAQVSLAVAVGQANGIIGFYSTRAGISSTVPVIEGKTAP